MINWIFNPTPPSGSIQGGDPSKRIFDINIDTLVREVIQNSKDAKIEDSTNPVKVTFELRELSGSYLHDFLNTINWDTLKKHVEAASKEKIKQAELYKIAIDKIEKSNKLTLLSICDYNTIGLCGPETTNDISNTGKKNYSSLVKDKLTSYKNEGAGGNYGLGKSCYWAFSELSTVLLYSVLYHLEPKQDKQRFIGRADLASHVIGKDAYTPDGWLGTEVETDKGKRADSLNGKTANEYAHKTYLQREESLSGTSILILGFQDPSSEKEESSDELENKIKKAVVKWWWPSMGESNPSLVVDIKRYRNNKMVSESNVSDYNEVNKLILIRDAYLSNTISNELINPGDIVRCPVVIPKIPGTLKGDRGPLENEELDLLVYLHDEMDKSDYYQNKIACYRGLEMVVKYDDPKRLFVSNIPFYAVLICGNARILGSDEGNKAVDNFLMNSEPPSHNEWSADKGVLKETYKLGYGKALKDIDKAVITILRDLLTKQAVEHDNGPSLLMQKFPLGHNEQKTPEKKDFTFNSLNAERTKDGWQYSGKVSAKKPLSNDWTVLIDFQLNDEDGGAEGGYIDSIKVDKGDAIIKDGKAIINVSSKIKSISFSGSSNLLKNKINPQRTTVKLAIVATERTS